MPKPEQINLDIPLDSLGIQMSFRISVCPKDLLETDPRKITHLVRVYLDGQSVDFGPEEFVNVDTAVQAGCNTISMFLQEVKTLVRDAERDFMRGRSKSR